jgi:epoxyqueuosine reductase QueG
LVLFAKYHPAEKSPAGRIGVSGYYAASNAAYARAGALAAQLQKEGVPALRDASLPARSLALLGGGRMGKNGFYYHPGFGSLVHIQTVRLAFAAAGPAAGPQACLACGACIRACPTGALGPGGLDVSKCMRSHMDGHVPDGMKPHLYQLLGCEKCQTACPMNGREGISLPDFVLADTIRGETMGELKRLVGKNMARRVRVTNQAVIVAANRGDASAFTEVQALADDPRFAEACAYYLARMRPKKD